jgi:DNA-binding transcriptional LysR family regulator
MPTTLKNSRLLDPRLFPAFIAAAELRNFTQAAESAHMTQSGVSQHIAKLEEQIGRPLFKRLGKTVTLTRAGEVLLQYIQEQVLNVNALFERIQVDEESVSGLVSYAMPPSCLLSGHFATLLERRLAHPELRLKVITAPSAAVLEMVLHDQVDFGFMTAKPEHAAVTFELYCNEEYVFVSVDPAHAVRSDPERIFDSPVVMFPGADIYYERWIQHHVPGTRRDVSALRVAGEINSIEGAIMMATGGVGCAVFPRHCVAQQLGAGLLYEHSTDAGPLTNPIYITRIADYRPTRRVQCVLDWFTAMLVEEQNATPVSPERRADYSSRSSEPADIANLAATTPRART